LISWIRSSTDPHQQANTINLFILTKFYSYNMWISFLNIRWLECGKSMRLNSCKNFVHFTHYLVFHPEILYFNSSHTFQNNLSLTIVSDAGSTLAPSRCYFTSHLPSIKWRITMHLSSNSPFSLSLQIDLFLCSYSDTIDHKGIESTIHLHST